MDYTDTLRDTVSQRGLGSVGVSVLGLIVSNLAVVWFVLARDVTPFQLVLVFWCECVWIGVFNALKLIAASLIGQPFENRFVDVSVGAALFSSVLVIFGASAVFFSCLGVILLAILAVNETFALSGAGDAVLNHIGLVVGVSFVLMAGHALSFVVNFLLLGEFRFARVGALVAQPFGRCGALFVAIVASLALIAFLPGLASTAVFGALVLGAKILLDLRLHLAERRAFAPSR